MGEFDLAIRELGPERPPMKPMRIGSTGFSEQAASTAAIAIKKAETFFMGNPICNKILLR